MIYNSQSEGLRIHCDLDLYKQVRGQKRFRDLEREAIGCGLPVMHAKMATDERLVYAIAKAKGMVE